MLPHIDDKDKSSGKQIGTNNHPRVLKTTDQAVQVTTFGCNLRGGNIFNLKLRMKRSWRAAEKLAKAAYTEWVTW